MEQIKLFVDNVFKNLPQNADMKRLKEEMLLNMEEKYTELKNQGKPDNEALGTVIAEFGNIDELIDEMNIDIESKESKNPKLDLPEIREYLENQTKISTYISIGVALIIIGVAIMISLFKILEGDIFFQGVHSNFNILPVIILFLFIIPAVGIFIYAGNLDKKYEFINKGDFDISYSTKSVLKDEYDEIVKKNNLSIIIGVSLCIASPIALFATIMIDNSYAVYGVSLLLIIVAVAVAMFILGANKSTSYNKIMKLGEYSDKKKEERKLIESIASIYWPVVVCIFLVSGLVYNQWGYNWVIFPIAGVLFGAISSAITAMKK